MNVVNLWVKREEKLRAKAEEELLWVCNCGSETYFYFLSFGLVCSLCQKKVMYPEGHK